MFVYMSLVIFSNSEYFFLWPIIEECVSQIKFHKIFVCDVNDLEKPKGFDEYIYYDEKHCYAKRWTCDILPNIASNYTIVVHDVQIIVNFDEEFIFKILQVMSEYSIDRCSLNVFDGNNIIQENGVNLCNLNSARGNTFTPYDVCPAIWNKNSFKLLFDTFHQETYRTSELNQNLQHFCRDNLRCFGMQKSIHKIYYCLGRPNLNQYKTLHITIQKKILHPIDVYMDMKEQFIYYANKYKLINFVKINNSCNSILTNFRHL
jgi:hypothetical protein